MSYPLNDVANKKHKKRKCMHSNHWSIQKFTWLFSFMMLFFALFTITSCEDEESVSEAQGTLLESYAYETQSLRVIGPDDMHAYTGNNPFLSVDGEGFHPQTGTLMVPGRSLSDNAVHPEDMLAILPVPEEHGTLSITNHARGGNWYRFSGEEFIPGSGWTPGNDGLDIPGSDWMPQGPDSLEVLMYTGEKAVSDLFGGADLSQNRIDLAEGESQMVESDKSRIGIAVTLDQLYNIRVSPRSNLAELFSEDPQEIDFPVYPDSSVWANPADGFFTVREEGASVKGIRAPLDVALIGSENFFSSDAFTPRTQSVFTVPKDELFPGLVYSGYQPSGSGSNPDLLFFTSDQFQETPNEIFSLHDPGVEMDVSGTMVVLPVSVLEIRPGLTLYLDPAVRTIGNSDAETSWPDRFYYHNDFAFPGELNTPGSSFTFLRPGMAYSSEALMDLGRSVDISLE